MSGDDHDQIIRDAEGTLNAFPFLLKALPENVTLHNHTADVALIGIN